MRAKNSELVRLFGQKKEIFNVVRHSHRIMTALFWDSPRAGQHPEFDSHTEHLMPFQLAD